MYTVDANVSIERNLENIQALKLAKMDLSQTEVLGDSLNFLYIRHCVKYNLVNNQCILCQEGFLFDENLNSCLEYRFKIEGNRGSQ